ncbi:MAG TPA: 16S rRNA (guanine(966)-N(2))-methyltransferase RsmD [Coriobacteriia bacterium]|nr:16S rRNA (guanine(966)-N(2))-methyltransferase RsmD [Coriobacteriia bacterium]
MRIIAGTHRGRRIEAPSGTRTRPTSDRVREGAFSRVEALGGGVPAAPVLDLFAGTGALGIEALSRGATHAVFCESDRLACAVLRSNLVSLGLAERATVVHDDVFAAVRRGSFGKGGFALLFLDPPYRIDKSEVRRAIERLVRTEALLGGALLVWEHAASDVATWPTEALRDLGERRYGDTTVSIARLEGGAG